jgi:Asp-tRNA(Asn)/Glu-tRNA(Gln) amidotransferase A subunit family amidase
MTDLTTFMQAYEKANNSHVWANVAPMIAPDATYWFTDGSYAGIDEIREAVEKTFEKLKDEVYTISDINWPVVTEEVAVCTYRFSWQATIDGTQQSGSGRGTNVLKHNDSWQIVHEHLSK